MYIEIVYIGANMQYMNRIWFYCVRSVGYNELFATLNDAALVFFRMESLKKILVSSDKCQRCLCRSAFLT